MIGDTCQSEHIHGEYPNISRYIVNRSFSEEKKIQNVSLEDEITIQETSLVQINMLNERVDLKENVMLCAFDRNVR